MELVSVLENRHQSRNAAAVISGPLSMRMYAVDLPVLATIFLSTAAV